MEVGLLSMHRVNNYGSFFQALCLKKMIESCDGYVDFIDIKPGKKESITVYKKHFNFSKIKRIPYYMLQRKKESIFLDSQNNVLKCSAEVNYREDYDSIIIGSDEVFNFVQKSPWGFTTQLYGDMNNSNVSTYAASFGNTTLMDIDKSGYRNDMLASLNNLKSISVRDNNSYYIIKELMGIEPEVHFDPVIVGDLSFEKRDLEVKDKYILIYSYDFRMCDKDVINQVRQIAKEERLKVYSVGFYQEWVDKNIIPTPEELLNYFYNAKYIVTDTFHGTIFSIRLHKQFITVVRDSNRQKLNDLLNRLNFEKSQYNKGDSIKRIMNIEIDYDAFENKRNIEKDRTLAYLRKCMI